LDFNKSVAVLTL